MKKFVPPTNSYSCGLPDPTERAALLSHSPTQAVMKEREVEPDSDESDWGGDWSGTKAPADNRVCTTPVAERALPPNNRRCTAPLSTMAVAPLPRGVRPPKRGCHQRVWKPSPLAIKLFGTPRGRPYVLG